MFNHRTDLGTPIVVHSRITKMIGLTASVLLSHIIYWNERTDNELGFYRTLGQLMNETGLTESELRSARAVLDKLGLVTTTHKRLLHRLYFKFNASVFDELLNSKKDELVDSENELNPSCDKLISPNEKFTGGEMRNPHFAIKDYKKDYNNNSLPPPHKKLPDDFVPNANSLAKLTDKGLNADTVLAKFKAYYADKTAGDWQASFELWVIREIDYTAKRKSTQKQNHTQKHYTDSQLSDPAEQYGSYGDYVRAVSQQNAKKRIMSDSEKAKADTMAKQVLANLSRQFLGARQ